MARIAQSRGLPIVTESFYRLDVGDADRGRRLRCALKKDDDEIVDEEEVVLEGAEESVSRTR